MVRHKEAIHSGHFMVSNFEAEAQDDEEDIAVPVRTISNFSVIIIFNSAQCQGINAASCFLLYRVSQKKSVFRKFQTIDSCPADESKFYRLKIKDSLQGTG